MKLSPSSSSSPASSTFTQSHQTRTSGCYRRRPHRVSFSLTETPPHTKSDYSRPSSTQSNNDDRCDPSQCWYTESELEAIKTEIRQCACRLFHSGRVRQEPLGDATSPQEPHEAPAATANGRVMSCSSRSNNDEDTSSSSSSPTAAASSLVCWRGLELKLSPERQQNRLLTIRAIVKAQTRFQNPDMLAFVAHKCSMWANQIAVQAATRDYFDVYEKATSSRDGSASTTVDNEEEDNNPLALPVVDAPNLLRTFRKRILHHHQQQQQQQQQQHGDDEENQRRVRQCTRPEVFV